MGIICTLLAIEPMVFLRRSPAHHRCQCLSPLCPHPRLGTAPEPAAAPRAHYPPQSAGHLAFLHWSSVRPCRERIRFRTSPYSWQSPPPMRQPCMGKLHRSEPTVSPPVRCSAYNGRQHADGMASLPSDLVSPWCPSPVRPIDADPLGRTPLHGHCNLGHRILPMACPAPPHGTKPRSDLLHPAASLYNRGYNSPLRLRPNPRLPSRRTADYRRGHPHPIPLSAARPNACIEA